VGLQKDMKAFYKKQPVAALVIGGYFAFGVILPVFGYSVLATKLVEYGNDTAVPSPGLSGYQTW